MIERVKAAPFGREIIAESKMRTRAQHLEFCKQRAREYLAKGDAVNAISSIMSDLNDHPETRNVNRDLVALCLIAAANKNVAAAWRLIDGFK